MNPSLQIPGAATNPAEEPGAEKRREVRRPAEGNVLIQWTNPRSQEVEGRLVDVSASGFRMAHGCSLLAAGQYVEFAHPEAKGRARVVWTRIVSGAVESGFVVAADNCRVG
jgi:hypothetical protein